MVSCLVLVWVILDMIDQIYNYANHNKIALAFLANEIARSRQIQSKKRAGHPMKSKSFCENKATMEHMMGDHAM